MCWRHPDAHPRERCWKDGCPACKGAALHNIHTAFQGLYKQGRQGSASTVTPRTSARSCSNAPHDMAASQDEGQISRSQFAQVPVCRLPSAFGSVSILIALTPAVELVFALLERRRLHIEFRQLRLPSMQQVSTRCSPLSTGTRPVRPHHSVKEHSFARVCHAQPRKNTVQRRAAVADPPSEQGGGGTGAADCALGAVPAWLRVSSAK
jgi:hypothetical protein